jgi:ABC-type transporter Mla maintaining outer membrane lipid asymmetry ATPase subunit MlaF
MPRCSARSLFAKTWRFLLQELTDKTPGEIDRIVDEKLEMVEMTGEDKAMPFELSGGMRKHTQRRARTKHRTLSR